MDKYLRLRMTDAHQYGDAMAAFFPAEYLHELLARLGQVDIDGVMEDLSKRLDAALGPYALPLYTESIISDVVSYVTEWNPEWDETDPVDGLVLWSFALVDADTDRLESDQLEGHMSIKFSTGLSLPCMEWYGETHEWGNNDTPMIAFIRTDWLMDALKGE